MTPKQFDDLILQVFESSENFFFPIVSQRQAKNFVKVLHNRGLEYNAISDEINETTERFSIWRKSLSCSKIGQRIIQRINQPFLQILQDEQDINANFEALFYVEPNYFSFEKKNAKRNSNLWRFLNKNKNSVSNLKKSDKLTFVSCEPNISNKVLSCLMKDKTLTYTNFSGNVGEPNRNSGDVINFHESKEISCPILDQSPESGNHIQICPHPSVQVERNEEERIKSSSDISSNEEQFCDCDSSKSCSSTFMDDSQIGHSVYYSCIQEANQSTNDQDLNASPPKESALLFEIESYNSDLDASTYNEVSPCLVEISHLIGTLRSVRSKGGFLYAFCENGLSHETLLKIGTSRNPDKKLLQASAFNTRLTMLTKIKVADTEDALRMARLKLAKWKIEGHQDWYQGKEECLQEFQNIKVNL